MWDLIVSVPDHCLSFYFSFCKTVVYNIRLLIIIERGCSSMYRKKERLDKSYAKEPLLAYLKAILVADHNL